MNRNDLIPYISHVLDNALSPDHTVADVLMPDGTLKPDVRLVVYQCGFEPLVVAVLSYLGGSVDPSDAEDIARDWLTEREWFSDLTAENSADYVL